MDRVRSAHPSASPSRSDLQREISRSLREILSANDEYAGEVRSDIAMVLREIDAGGTAFRAAIEAGDEELEHEVLTAAETVSAEFGEMEFLLADLARAAGEIQDSLGGQGAELRAAIEQVARQSADVRVIREELAVMEQRGRPWMPGSGGPGAGRPAMDQRLSLPRAAALRPGPRGGVLRPRTAHRRAGRAARAIRPRHADRRLGGG